MSVCVNFQLSSWSRIYFSGPELQPHIVELQPHIYDDRYSDNKATSVRLSWDNTELGNKKYLRLNLGDCEETLRLNPNLHFLIKRNNCTYFLFLSGKSSISLSSVIGICACVLGPAKPE